MSNKVLKTVRYNPASDSYDYYFPREITDSTDTEQKDLAHADREYAKLNHLQVGLARLGFRTFEAIFIPCKHSTYGPKGNLVFLDTPEEEQRRIFLDLIKDEMKWQDEIKQDGRCQIPDGNGGVKRCPCRIPNPNYVEGGDAPKTIPVKCEGCLYDSFRQAHTTVPFSTLEYEDEDGETESYEATTPSNYYEADHYERICDDFLDYVQEHNASLTGLADLLIREYSRSEAARKLGIAVSTAGSRKEQLKELCRNFLDSTISF